jgi:hypothetical protein
MWGLITLIFIGEIRPKSEMKKKRYNDVYFEGFNEPPPKIPDLYIWFLVNKQKYRTMIKDVSSYMVYTQIWLTSS